MKKTIKGFGGGGGKGGGGGSARVAVEAPDSLRSKAFARVLDLICEGEIEGLVDGAKSIYLDETPLQNEDGSFNFQGLEMTSRNGTQWQEHIPGFPSVENEAYVGVEVKASAAVTRQVSNPEIDAVRVRISIPQLTSQNMKNGDINGTSVQYGIELQSNGGGFFPVLLGRETRPLTESGGVWSTTFAIQSATLNAYAYVQTNNAYSYHIQSRPKGSTGSWNTLTTRSISPSYYRDESGDYYVEAYPYTYSENVAEGQYEYRAVTASGSGSVSINSATGYGGVGYDTVSGKTTSKYERSYRVDLIGEAPWDIRVKRFTADSTASALQNKTFWESYTEIIDAKLRYPNSALVGIKIDSSQFNSIPTRAYDMKLLKVKVPTNYNPETRAYTGIWDGTFKIAWTDNPAWCFYDLLTNERYGLGGLLDESQIDKWAIYSSARYCDELVPDGFGGTEPRFTCNMYIQSRNDAFRVMQDMASIFRGMIYWQSGAVTVAQDAPADPVHLYTPANVIDGIFNYQGSSAKMRHSVAMVSWNDPDDFFRQKVEYVEDAAAIARYGIVQTDVTAIGCTSRGQANRVGRWLLYSEQSESEIVAFKTGMDGAVCRPGQIIAVSDPVRGGTRRGGRVLAATVSTITIDAPVILPAGGNTISVMLPDGTVENRTVASVAGSNVLTAAPFSQAPAAGAIWVIESTNLQNQLFKVVSVVESDDNFEVNALAHNPGKYDAIENDLVLQPRAISILSIAPEAPTNIVINESLYESQAEVKTVIGVSWDAVQSATSYLVAYKIGDGNFINLSETQTNSIELRDATDGVYEFKVIAINSIGKRSPASSKTQTILAQTAPPSDVQNFSLIPVVGMAYLSWDKAVDLDVLVGGTVRIRWTPKTSLQDWNDAVDILPAMSGNQRNAQAPLLSGTYMAKFVDSSGNPSTNATLIVTEMADSLSYNVVETVTESTAFTGTKTNCVVDFGSGELQLSVVGGEVQPAGTYLFANSVDLGAVYPSRLSAYIEARGFAMSDFIDARVALIDTWEDFDGASIETVTGLLYMRTTNDNPAGSPTWSEWKPFFVGEYTARAYQFKLELTSNNYDHNIGISALSVTVDMPDRVESKTGLVSGAASYSVTFTEAFKATPTIGVTANNMASGDYYTISGQSPTGFDIIFKNAAGTAVSRTFDVLAKGYGRAI